MTPIQTREMVLCEFYPAALPAPEQALAITYAMALEIATLRNLVRVYQLATIQSIDSEKPQPQCK